MSGAALHPQRRATVDGASRCAPPPCYLASDGALDPALVAELAAAASTIDRYQVMDLLGDLNGDGKPDIVYDDGEAVTVLVINL
ncbi:hypothetical protein WME99_16160 [Sorangium sp. So ce136]|uniref:hypothetical protein n=1 Tax=Sorangium sp. So ce136 TaxID=3133284 RepID=UPI003F0CE592